MSVRIQTLEELRAEIKLLKLQKAEQELYFLQKRAHIKETFSSPMAFFRNIKSLLGGGPYNSEPLKEGANQSDWTTNIARFLVPFLLNKTLLKGNGALIKSLLGIVSQKVINGETFNKVKIASWIDKATSWVNSTLKKSKKTPVDYGIPPDSETY